MQTQHQRTNPSRSTSEPAPSGSTGPRVVFIHPDLGIGGAERLIVDAAVGLQESGYTVTIFTSHCDPQHCFDEARDGTLQVRVRGNSLFPPNVLNRFHILFATLRQMHLILSISTFTSELNDLRPTFFVVDQLSACVPFLRWRYPKQRILFYCHFPDQLLAKRDEPGLIGFIKRAYRFPFDWFEGWSMSASDRIVVNSNFTKSVANHVFTNIGDVSVIYPCVNAPHLSKSPQPLWPGKKILLSINRFERKKDIGLAIRAFHAVPANLRASARLVLAGGYDPRVSENVEYHLELISLATSLGLSNVTMRTVPTALAVPSAISVLFLLSIPSTFKSDLLNTSTLLLYTPTNEHFGIVPVEAMAAGLPVLAANTGGPLETVIDGQTGWLRNVDDVPAWSEVIHSVLKEAESSNPTELRRMGMSGRERAEQVFSQAGMALRFSEELLDMRRRPRPKFLEWAEIKTALALCGVFIAALLGLVIKAVGRGRVSATGAINTREEL